METPTPLPPESCGTCVFYLSKADECGVCRRYPPSCIERSEANINYAGDRLYFTAYPEVDLDQWCGEYRRPGIFNPPPPLPEVE